MRQTEFESKYQDNWQEFSELCQKLRKRKEKLGPDSDFSRQYRNVCNNLAIARERGYSPHLIERLHNQVTEGHQLMYQKRIPFFSQIWRFFAREFPQMIRADWKLFVFASLLFYGPGVIIGALLQWFPDLIYTLMQPEQVSSFESMYDPNASKLGRERASDDDVLMFGIYIMNNISIGFKTFATGIFFGVGSLFQLLFQGVYIGAVFGHLIRVGYHEPLFSFVVAHGAFELTGLVIAGMAGMKLGWALIAPGKRTRIEALKHNALIAVKIMFGVFALLLIAAFVEAFWSATTLFNLTFKLSVGAVCWIAVFAYLFLVGRRSGS